MSNEELVMKIKSGETDPDDMLQLYQQNKGLIMHLIRPFQRFSEEAEAEGEARYMDLKQEAFLALYAAVEGFDPSEGWAFSAYLSRQVKNALMKYSYKAYGVKMPDYAVNNVARYRRLVEEFIQQNGRDPKDEELLEEFNPEGFHSLEILENVKKQALILGTVSLDQPIRSDEGEEAATLKDLQADPAPLIEEDVTDQLIKEQIKAELWEAVEELPEKQADVLRMKYREEMDGDQIRAELGVTRQAINQLERRGYRKIRQSERGEGLRKMCYDAGLFLYQNPMRGTGLTSWKTSGYSAPERVVISALEGLEDPEELDNMPHL